MSLYKEAWWWDAVSLASGYPYKVLKHRTSGGREALIPVFQHNLPFIRRVGSPLRGTFTPYIGMQWAPPVPEAAHSGAELSLSALLDEVRHEFRPNWMEFGYPADQALIAKIVHTPPFWSRVDKYTYALSLPDDEGMAWSMLESRARNMIRKAIKAGVKVVVVDSADRSLDGFYRMLKDTFAKSGRNPPHAKRFYRVLLEHLLGQDRLLFLGAELRGEIVAYGMFPHNAYEMCYLSGTSSAAGNTAAANSLVQWEAIRFGIKRGLMRYDLGGGGIASIDKFKASFGGVRERFVHFVAMSGWIRAAFHGYLAARLGVERLRSRLAAPHQSTRPSCLWNRQPVPYE